MLLGLSDTDVLALYAATPHDEAGYATIGDTLEAGRVPGYSLAAADPAVAGECTTALYPWAGNTAPRLILGVALPEPHAIAVTGGTWWSWGEPFNPAEWPELVVEEAWTLWL